MKGIMTNDVNEAAVETGIVKGIVHGIGNATETMTGTRSGAVTGMVSGIEATDLVREVKVDMATANVNVNEKTETRTDGVKGPRTAKTSPIETMKPARRGNGLMRILTTALDRRLWACLLETALDRPERKGPWIARPVIGPIGLIMTQGMN